MTQDITQKLKEASSGLLMMSESDYPFEVVRWQNAAPATQKRILQLTNSQNLPIEVVELDYFFRNCAFEQEWHNQLQKQDIPKFQRLMQTLRYNLNAVQVYRVGQTNIDAYIDFSLSCFTTPNSDYLGLFLLNQILNMTAAAKPKKLEGSGTDLNPS